MLRGEQARKGSPHHKDISLSYSHSLLFLSETVGWPEVRPSIFSICHPHITALTSSPPPLALHHRIIGKNFSVKNNSVLTLPLSSGWSQEQQCGGASPLTSQTLHKHCINPIPSTSSRDKRLTHFLGKSCRFSLWQFKKSQVLLEYTLLDITSIKNKKHWGHRQVSLKRKESHSSPSCIFLRATDHAWFIRGIPSTVISFTEELTCDQLHSSLMHLIGQSGLCVLGLL